MKKLILVWLGLCTLIFGEPRDWTTAEGGKTIKADYVKSSDGKVTIRRSPDRRLFTIDLTTLSEADGEWVKAKELEIEEEKIASEGKEASEEFGKLLTGDWERKEGHGLRYRIFGERKMKRSKDVGYPLVVWLHGRGGDVMTPEQPGQARVFTGDENFRKRPCFVIAPQNPDQLGWNGAKADGVVEIVEELLKNLPIDPDRVYLAGYSMGGYGTFHILAQEPKLFAAGVPIAGGGNPGSASNFKKVPVWVFHGAKDPTVPVSQSQAMVEALKKERAEVKYTEYPEGDHGVVGEVLETKELHEWLFEQSRGKK
jgi:predicted peptidase